MKWGAQAGGADDRSSYVCHNGIPITMWFAGEVKTVYLTNPDKVLQRVAITVAPLVPTDLDDAHHFIRSSEHLDPGISEENIDSDSIRFARWMNTSKRMVSELYYLHIILFS